jgi:hypothetical protein
LWIPQQTPTTLSRIDHVQILRVFRDSGNSTRQSSMTCNTSSSASTVLENYIKTFCSR